MFPGLSLLKCPVTTGTNYYYYWHSRKWDL